MTTSIIYKFRSAVTFEALPLAGHAVRLRIFDTKKAIVKAKKLDRGRKRTLSCRCPKRRIYRRDHDGSVWNTLDYQHLKGKILFAALTRMSTRTVVSD